MRLQSTTEKTNVQRNVMTNQKIEEDMNELKQLVINLDNTLTNITLKTDKHFDRVEARFDTLEDRFEGIEGRMDTMASNIKDIKDLLSK